MLWNLHWPHSTEVLTRPSDTVWIILFCRLEMDLILFLWTDWSQFSLLFLWLLPFLLLEGGLGWFPPLSKASGACSSPEKKVRFSVPVPAAKLGRNPHWTVQGPPASLRHPLASPSGGTNCGYNDLSAASIKQSRLGSLSSIELSSPARDSLFLVLYSFYIYILSL